MNISKGLLLLFSMLPVFLSATAAFATTVSGKASTVVEFFDNVSGETVVPVYQYLNLSIKDIAGGGYNFRSYGRLADDLANKDDIDSRLYYAFLEKRDFSRKNLDLRLGRQYISTAAGSSILDGISLKSAYDGLGKRINFTFFGGGDLAYYKGYEEQDLMLGVEAASEVYENLNIGLSYLQKWDSGDITHEIIGATLDYRYPALLNIYSDLQYSWIKKEFTYILAGMKYHGSQRFSLRTEYLYSLPVFSADSIYSVFAAEEYEEIMGELTYKLGPGVRAFGRYTREMYDEFADADVFEAGIEKVRTRTRRLSGYLIAEIRDDNEGQNMEGVKFYLGYLAQSYLNVGCGVHYNVFERRLTDEYDETTNARYWLDTSIYLTRKMNLQFKLERLENELYQDSFRGRLRFNVKF